MTFGLLALASCTSPRSDSATAQVPVSAGSPVQAPAPASAQTPVSVTEQPREVGVTASDRISPAGKAALAAHKALRPEVEKALRTVDPARVFATAKPGPDVPALRIEGPSEQRIQPGESAPVTVRTAPDEVVTFFTKEGGLFPNQQSCITVLADETGIARTLLTANPGTVDDVYIMAGSPAAIGTISLVVHVLYPDSPLVLAPQP